MLVHISNSSKRKNLHCNGALCVRVIYGYAVKSDWRFVVNHRSCLSRDCL